MFCYIFSGHPSATDIEFKVVRVVSVDIAVKVKVVNVVNSR
jgi:hypothetical protein